MRYVYWLLLWPLSLFDAEKVHHWMLLVLRRLSRWARHPRLKRPIQILMGATPAIETAHALPKTVMGLEFQNPIGLAAGMDKNGTAIEAFALLGFGFVELGTVTPLPQEGNPQPRLFRDYQKKVIFNAMGFNNEGVEALKRNIQDSKPYLDPKLVLGVNVGKNKATPLDQAARDYATCVRELYDSADYFTLNVSSPNTAGLRGLQNFSELSKILDGVMGIIEQKIQRRPLLIKLAPEMPEELLKELISEVEKNYPISGWILTNTLQRPCPFRGSAMETGGISGFPLFEAARVSLQIARSVSNKTLISSGGILNADEACYRLAMGADLIQLYSGLIFEGPALVGDICKRLPNL